MKIPTIPIQAKPFLWGAAVGAMALALVGFSWGGWETGTAAEKMARDRADDAVVAALTPVCVDQFQRSANATANLAELKDVANSWDQRNYVSEGGWATMPGSSAKADRQLASACAAKLNEITL